MNKDYKDTEIDKLIQEERKRQLSTLQLIPSENYTSGAVREALGSVLVHKYSEGQIGKRYYEGNEIIDEIERLCKIRALKTFKLDKSWHVNVQAHAGSNANLAVYNALLKSDQKILSMYLFEGGHISHGWKYKGRSVSISAKLYETSYYHVNKETGTFDYGEIRKTAQREKPRIIISGGTAYPRTINHEKLSEIAQEVNAFYMADIAHEAGLIAAEVNTSPFPYADVVTMTTHKTLRGPKGALIFCKKEYAEQIDRSVFPGLQGGPMNNNIAAIAVALKEAQSNKFKTYAKQVVRNAKVLAEELKKHNFKLISDGTDKHLILVDLRDKEISGKYAARALSLAGIILNKNTIPGEPGSPFDPSGIRLGTPFITTMGMKEKEMKQIAEWINKTISITQPSVQLPFTRFQKKVSEFLEIKTIHKEVTNLCKNFSLTE